LGLQTANLEIATTAGTDVLDLTEEVQAFISKSGIGDGVLVIFTPGSTAGITTIEFESGAVADLKRVLNRIAPESGEYEHDLRWGDGNGYSHVRSALVGPSLSVPVVGGRPDLGTWQQIVLCDFDNRPRHRRVRLQVVGA
jgi:secondary thiamine-phosphate synthase enzyme